MYTNTISTENHKLTIWIRAGGDTVKSQISSFVENLFTSLPESVLPKVLICTNQGDTILELLNVMVAKTEKIVSVIFSDLRSFSKPLTTLALNTDSESDVLTLSVGISITKEKIQTGLKHLIGNVKVYGWMIEGHNNDGSCPGKGWYNTAALIHKTIIQQMKEGIPDWVDNEVLGKIGKHIIGGSEEIPIMVEALQRDPKTEFILNTSEPVSSTLQLATGITFQEKLERKTIVAIYYLQKMHQEYKAETDFPSWQKLIWASLKVI